MNCRYSGIKKLEGGGLNFPPFVTFYQIQLLLILHTQCQTQQTFIASILICARHSSQHCQQQSEGQVLQWADTLKHREKGKSTVQGWWGSWKFIKGTEKEKGGGMRLKKHRLGAAIDVVLVELLANSSTLNVEHAGGERWREMRPGKPLQRQSPSVKC